MSEIIESSVKKNKTWPLVLMVMGMLIFLLVAGYFITKDKGDNYYILSIDESRFILKDELSQDKYQNAIDELNKFKDEIIVDGSNPTPWFYFGSWKKYLGDYEGARLAWEKAYELNPLRFATSNNLGDIYANFIIDYDKAEFFYLKALELRPEHYSTYMKLADLYRYQLTDKQDELEPLLNQGIENDPANSKQYLEYLYDYYREGGDEDKAVKYRQQILIIDPDYQY